MLNRRLTAVLLASLFLPAGCSQVGLLFYKPAIVRECPGPLPPIDREAADFTQRIRIHIESEKVTQGYDLVLQKRGARLTVVGLTRFGARAFSVVQDGTDLTVESAMKQLETVPPANIVRDLHRWPLRTVATAANDGVELEVDGHIATLVNRRCGYRATIVKLDTDDSEPTSR